MTRRRPWLIGGVALGWMALALALLLGLGGGSGCKDREKWNVLLITMDTTRADRLRCYGHNWIETPNLNELADQGVLFENAYSHVPLTLPAHTSIMTGIVPAQHGVVDNGAYLVPDELETMAEILKNEGYSTGAVISAAVLKKVFNLDQGFDYWDEEGLEEQEEKSLLVADRPADQVTDAAISWLNDNHDGPFFLWAHYYDPHAERRAPEPYKSIYLIPYDAEIAFMDSEIGRLLARIDELGKGDNTLVIAMGDHGESLGEHGEDTHGLYVYNATQHVPLIMKVPGLEKRGKRLDTVASQADILPTTLDFLGLPSPAGINGESLKSLVLAPSEPETERYAYMESKYVLLHFGWAPVSGMTSKRFKFIKLPEPELYDLAEDPRETRNLLAGYVTAEDGTIVEDGSTAESGIAIEENLSRDAATSLAFLKNRLDTGEKKWSSNRLDTQEADISEREMQQLQALGYVVDGFQGDPERARQKDPKNYIDLIGNLQGQESALAKGEFSKVLELAKIAIERDPENPLSLSSRAEAYYGLGMYEQALEAYEKFFEIHGENAQDLLDMGNIYIRMAQEDPDMPMETRIEYLTEAEKFFQQSIGLEANNKPAYYFLGRIAMVKGDIDKAREHFNRPEVLDSEYHFIGMAKIYEIEGRPGAAEAAYKDAEALSGEKSVIFWQEWAQFLMSKERYAEVVENLERAIDIDPSLKNEPMLMSALEEARRLMGD